MPDNWPVASKVLTLKGNMSYRMLEKAIYAKTGKTIAFGSLRQMATGATKGSPGTIAILAEYADRPLSWFYEEEGKPELPSEISIFNLLSRINLLWTEISHFSMADIPFQHEIGGVVGYEDTLDDFLKESISLMFDVTKNRSILNEELLTSLKKDLYTIYKLRKEDFDRILFGEDPSMFHVPALRLINEMKDAEIPSVSREATQRLKEHLQKSLDDIQSYNAIRNELAKKAAEMEAEMEQYRRNTEELEMRRKEVAKVEIEIAIKAREIEAAQQAKHQAGMIAEKEATEKAIQAGRDKA